MCIATYGDFNQLKQEIEDLIPNVSSYMQGIEKGYKWGHTKIQN